MLCGRIGVMFRMQLMTMRDMRVMARLVMFAFFVMLGRLTMMLRRVLVMLGGGLMIRGFVGAGYLPISLECGISAPALCRGFVQPA